MSPKEEPHPYLPLSTRAQEAAVAETKNPLLDILADLWHPESNPNGFFSVGIAENVLMHDVLLEYINKQLTLPAKYLTYNDGGAGSTRLKKATARFLNRHLTPFTPIQPHHLAITNGVSSAIEQLSWIFANPGDAKVVPVSFEDCHPLEPAAVEKYEQALLQFESQTSNKARALVLCHPHNPLGRCYPTQTIIEIMRLCQKYQIHLISDEIYALSTWENRIDPTPTPVKFESLLSINPTGIIDPGLTHILWGMSKDFGANGIRIGVIVSQANAGLHSALRGTSLYTYVSGLSDYIAANILEDDAFTDRYIEMNRQRLRDSYHFVAEYLQQRGLEYERGGNAGFFIWVNLGKKYLENRQKIHYDGPDLTQEVMDRLCSQKVFLASGNAFGSEKPGWFRIVTSHPIAYLTEALQRIELAIGN